jgi:hypothetical protein
LSAVAGARTGKGRRIDLKATEVTTIAALRESSDTGIHQAQ